jgi:hypothetical protein
MKVLEEIVAYLHHRGVLADDEVRAFESAGFIRRRTENLDDSWPPEPYDPDPHDVYLPASAVLPPRPAAGRRPRKTLSAGVIASRTNAFLREHDDALGALGRVAELPSAGTRWERIARLARADSAAIAPALAASIDAGASSFNGLWSAIGIDGHLALVNVDEHGPAVSAYRALGRSSDHRDLGKYIWLLRRRAFARLHDLLSAQRRAASAFLLLASARPELFGKWLSRDYHALGYWTLVLLHNAGRRAAGHRAEARSSERPVRRMLPDAAVFSRAWALALELGGAPAREFLHAFLEAEIVSRRVWGILAYSDKPERYSDVWADNVIAGEEKPAHAEVFRRLREAMAGAARLDAAPGRAFLDELQRDNPPLLAGLGSAVELSLPSHPHVALFCPIGWD